MIGEVSWDPKRRRAWPLSIQSSVVSAERGGGGGGWLEFSVNATYGPRFTVCEGPVQSTMDEGLNGFHCDAAAFFWTKIKVKYTQTL